MLLAIALGISSIFLGQVKVVSGLGYSVIAFYAADAGIESILMVREDTPPSSPCTKISPCALSNGATYYLDIVAGGSCSAANYCIKSIGSYKGTNRAIEITY